MQLLKFPTPHGRTSNGATPIGERAAKSAISLAVMPALEATSVDRIGDHQSAGMLSRCHHLETAAAVAPQPTSDAMASLDAQSSTIARNEVGPNMPTVLGQTVLKCNDKTSYDCGQPLAENSSMAERMSETEETLAFIQRVRAAREAKFNTQKPVYNFLGIAQDQYKHYEVKRPLPRRYIPKFCIITEVSMEWLLTGEGKGPAVPEYPRDVPKRIRRVPRGKAA